MVTALINTSYMYLQLWSKWASLVLFATSKLEWATTSFIHSDLPFSLLCQCIAIQQVPKKKIIATLIQTTSSNNSSTEVFLGFSYSTEFLTLQHVWVQWAHTITYTAAKANAAITSLVPRSSTPPVLIVICHNSCSIMTNHNSHSA